MSITRVAIDAVDHFTIVPNEWARDGRLSLRARGLLALLLSHRPGWQVTIESLARENPEGKDAIQSAVVELEQAGYLVRAAERNRDEQGRLQGRDWSLQNPWSEPTAGFPAQADPAQVNPPPKKTIPQKTNNKETPSGGSAVKRIAREARPATYRRKATWTPRESDFDSGPDEGAPVLGAAERFAAEVPDRAGRRLSGHSLALRLRDGIQGETTNTAAVAKNLAADHRAGRSWELVEKAVELFLTSPERYIAPGSGARWKAFLASRDRIYVDAENVLQAPPEAPYGVRIDRSFD